MHGNWYLKLVFEIPRFHNRPVIAFIINVIIVITVIGEVFISTIIQDKRISS